MYNAKTAYENKKEFLLTQMHGGYPNIERAARESYLKMLEQEKKERATCENIVLKNQEELKLGECAVIYEMNGVRKRYEGASVCDIHLTKGGSIRVVYFILPGEAKIIGYEQ